MKSDQPYASGAVMSPTKLTVIVGIFVAVLVGWVSWNIDGLKINSVVTAVMSGIAFVSLSFCFFRKRMIRQDRDREKTQYQFYTEVMSQIHHLLDKELFGNDEFTRWSDEVYMTLLRWLLFGALVLISTAYVAVIFVILNTELQIVWLANMGYASVAIFTFRLATVFHYLIGNPWSWPVTSESKLKYGLIMAAHGIVLSYAIGIFLLKFGYLY